MPKSTGCKYKTIIYNRRRLSTKLKHFLPLFCIMSQNLNISPTKSVWQVTIDTNRTDCCWHWRNEGVVLQYYKSTFKNFNLICLIAPFCSLTFRTIRRVTQQTVISGRNTVWSGTVQNNLGIMWFFLLPIRSPLWMSVAESLSTYRGIHIPPCHYTLQLRWEGVKGAQS